MKQIDVYHKKTIPFSFGDHELEFMVSQELFSSQDVDYGTQRLLRTFLFEEINDYTKVLDVGCGYGPLGITLKTYQPDATVHCVDRDALALAFTQANAELNDITEGVTTSASLGFDGVTDTDYDLIVSNVPAKVGEPVLVRFIQDARNHLQPGGRVAIVVIDAIAPFVRQQLEQDETIEILYEHSWPGHQVFHYTFSKPALQTTDAAAQPAYESGAYHRQTNQFFFLGIEFAVQTTYNESEFDQLSFETQLLLEELEERELQEQDLEQVLIFNPGQGYIPLGVIIAHDPQQMYLVDRDLQALKISADNLALNNYNPDRIIVHHQVGIDIGATDLDLIVGIMPDKLSLDAYQLYIEQAAEQLKAKGEWVLSAGSTTVTRIEELLKEDDRFKIVDRSRDKHRSVLSLRRV